MSNLTPATAAPQLSAILITPGRPDLLAGTLAALSQQTAKQQIEIVIVGVPESAVDKTMLIGFWGYQVLEYAPFTSTSEARAIGIRAASASVIAMTEDHSFPESTWAEHLIAAHQTGTWAGIGPTFVNFNPATLTSWINLVMEYGCWMEPIAPGEKHHIPGHNSTYRRDVLLNTYGEKLGVMLEAESTMQWDLQAKGHKFGLEPKARTRHQNYSLFGRSLKLRFHGGRLFAANRARQWSIGKRAFYTLASPLIPWIRLTRLIKEFQRIGQGHLFPKVLPGLWIQVMLDGLGETVGYATGVGSSMRILTVMEVDRPKNLHPSDRALFTGQTVSV